eukprot:2418112-Rhodomonas_salina.1
MKVVLRYGMGRIGQAYTGRHAAAPPAHGYLLCDILSYAASSATGSFVLSSGMAGHTPSSQAYPKISPVPPYAISATPYAVSSTHIAAATPLRDLRYALRVWCYGTFCTELGYGATASTGGFVLRSECFVLSSGAVEGFTPGRYNTPYAPMLSSYATRCTGTRYAPTQRAVLTPLCPTS